MVKTKMHAGSLITVKVVIAGDKLELPLMLGWGRWSYLDVLIAWNLFYIAVYCLINRKMYLK